MDTELHLQTNAWAGLHQASEAKTDPTNDFPRRLVEAKSTACLPTEDQLVARVIGLIDTSLGVTNCSLDEAAAAVGMSRRTLQRQLARRGTSLAKLRTELRGRLARELLTVGPVNVRALARALGYQKETAFHRAFRKWTGTTPLTYARRMRDRAGALEHAQSVDPTELVIGPKEAT